MFTCFKLFLFIIVCCFAISDNLRLRETQTNLCLFDNAKLVTSGSSVNYYVKCNTNLVSLDLNACLQNNNGDLKKGAGFSARCSNCSLMINRNIQCTCSTNLNIKKLSNFDIVSILKYQNQILTCMM